MRRIRVESTHKMRKMYDGEISLADAQFLIARSYAFESWPKFKKHMEAILREHSPVSIFESAADAVIAGDIGTLNTLLQENPALIRERSTRFHQSTLLHYVSANGVEDFRQKTPPNAVDVAKLLLNAGAEVDAENNPGRGTTLGLVATSYHPARAGVQIALLETLLDAGASVDGLPGGWNPTRAALANGRGDAAGFLAQRGARLDLESACGAGRLDTVQSFFQPDGSLKPAATKEQMIVGFAWACEYGRTSVVEFLLRMGVNPTMILGSRGPTGLHWAGWQGSSDIVRMLLKHGAPVNIKDETHDGTPLEWTIYAWGDPPPEAHRENYYEVVALLVNAGATVDPAWLSHPYRERPLIAKIQADPRMQAALRGEFAP